jgi:hypothetical protein
VSLGFRAALAGIAMTLLSWYGPWAWPAWPAFAAIGVLFGHSGFAELAYGVRSAVVVALIVLNVSTWALVVWTGTMLLRKLRTS